MSENTEDIDGEEKELTTDVHIIPTSHASEESKNRVSKKINETNPDCIAVELDRKRYAKLKETGGHIEDKSLRDMLSGSSDSNLKKTILSYSYSKIQNTVASSMGVDFIGRDMLEGCNIASENSIPLALVDQDVDVTFKRLSSEITAIEILKSASYMILGISYLKFNSNSDSKKSMIKDDPDVDEMVRVLEEKFPKIKKVIIDERDKYISENIISLSKNYNNIVLVVGAAHMSGIKNHLDKQDNINALTPENTEINVS